MVHIRVATLDDAESIHGILQDTWGESLLFDVFTDHVASPEHQVFVADEAGEVTGFLSAFLVRSAVPRWELDLIIVRSTSRGTGVGTALIQKALRYGSELGVRWAKASIRVDNTASQRAFSKAGFTTDAHVRTLLLWEPSACESAPTIRAAEVSEIDLIPVDTFTYRGLWIEGFVESELSSQEQHAVIRAARNRVFQEDRLNTGAFIPDSLKQTIAPDLFTAATDFGQYHRWHYAFK